MADFNEPKTADENPLDGIIADYLQQVEAGEVPDREALLAQHPEMAEGLRAFFADYDRLDRQAADFRLPADPNPTTDFLASGSQLPRVQYFGDYELLEVIARGGMGVVYKARQVSLNRLVALKMILKGELATPRDVARFRAEAEAAANLDHPNIVPIYEVGEHDGQQYYAMRYIEGSSLALHPRADPHKEAELVATVTRAVYHAHQRGILHRDIKPSNILVDPVGVPFVADFGLAKRVDANQSFTESGALVGTPRYMPPEQAAGRKDLTVTADVYSLGVVLYERLTGQTPFTGETPLEILRKVREYEPPRPSSITPGLDRDLETICLKCLDKDPAKRYGTAEALAEDLERYLLGEPILARPAGQTERLWRWCKRNPVVAGLSSGLAVALLAGTIISIAFARKAEDRRDRAEKAELIAIAAQEEVEISLARSLVRPLSLNGGDTLTEMEAEALWELAENPGNRLWLRFVEEAAGTELAVSQFTSRAEPALIAAIGLNQEKRRRAKEILTKQFRTPDRGPRYQLGICRVVLSLGNLEPGLVTDISDFLLRLLGEKKPLENEEEIVNLVLACTDQMKPENEVKSLGKALEVAKLSTAHQTLAKRFSTAAGSLSPEVAASLLKQVMVTENDLGALHELAEGLSAATGLLSPDEASRVLIWALDRERILVNPSKPAEMLKVVPLEFSIASSKFRVSLADRLSEVAAKLVPKEAVKVLMEALEKETDPYARRELAKGLSAGTIWLAPIAVAKGLGEALEKEKDSGIRMELAKGLSKVAAWLAPNESVEALRQAARTLEQEMEKSIENNSLPELADGWLIVAKGLPPNEAARVLRSMASVLGKELAKAENKYSLAKSLSTVAAQLAPDETVKVLGQAARALEQAMEKAADFDQLLNLAESLAVVIGKLPPDQADRMVQPMALALGQALENARGIYDSEAFTRVLLVVIDRLTPDNAARVLWQTLENRKSTIRNDLLVDGFTAIAERLVPGEAVKLLQKVMVVKELSHSHERQLAKSLSLAAGGLKPDEADRVLGQAAEFLEQALEKETIWLDYSLAQGLSTLAGGMKVDEGAEILGQAAKVLVLAMEKREIQNKRFTLAAGLSELTGCLEPGEAARICTPVVQTLLREAESMDEGFTRYKLESALALLLHRLEPAQATLLSRKLSLELLASRIVNFHGHNWGDPSDKIVSCLSDARPAEVISRAFAVTTAVGVSCITPFPAFQALPSASEPLPSRLNTQDLVELLKMPTCFGKARQVILKHLDNRFGRVFKNHWEFVSYAKEQGLELDFTTPPKRPKVVKSAKN